MQAAGLCDRAPALRGHAPNPQQRYSTSMGVAQMGTARALVPFSWTTCLSQSIGSLSGKEQTRTISAGACPRKHGRSHPAQTKTVHSKCTPLVSHPSIDARPITLVHSPTSANACTHARIHTHMLVHTCVHTQARKNTHFHSCPCLANQSLPQTD